MYSQIMRIQLINKKKREDVNEKSSNNFINTYSWIWGMHISFSRKGINTGHKERLIDDGNEVIANEFIRWDEIYGRLDTLFYKDRLPYRLHFRPGGYDQYRSDLLEINYEEIRDYINKEDATLREVAPYLDSEIIGEGSKDELLSDYMSNDYQNGNRYCLYFFSKPVFVQDRFCFLYEESFCGPENAGGQLNVYMIIKGEWVMIGAIYNFIS